MYPRLFPGIFITNYGILVTLGFLIGLWVTLKLSDRTRIERTTVVDIAIWGLIWGLVGAKVGLILLDLPDYLRQPSRILGTLRYAGVFYVGFAAAVVYLIYTCRRRELRFFEVTDLFAPGLALAHAIGRLGCFAAGCCYGTACNLPWAVTFNSAEAEHTVGTPLHTPLHPVQLYESAGNLAIFGLLLLFWKRSPRRGWISAAYLLLYASSRFVWEFFRGDPRGRLGPLSTSQWIAVAVVAATLAGFLWSLRAGRGEHAAEENAAGRSEE